MYKNYVMNYYDKISKCIPEPIFFFRIPSIKMPRKVEYDVSVLTFWLKTKVILWTSQVDKSNHRPQIFGKKYHNSWISKFHPKLFIQL